MGFLKRFKLEKHVVECLFILALVSLVLFTELSHEAYAEVEYWELSAGGKTFAVTGTEEDAEIAIDRIEHYYTKDDSTNVSVTMTPQIKVEKKTYDKDSAPAISDTSKIVEDAVRLTKGKDPVIKIRTVQTFRRTKKIPFGKTIKKSDSLIKGATKVSFKGKKGLMKLSREVVSVNGKTVSAKTVASKVIKKPKDKVVLLGTKKDDVVDRAGESGSAGRAFKVKKNGKTYKASMDGSVMGRKVADYALQFVGNPYVYGGSDLVKGADCSGFTLAVYKHFGVSLPHDAGAQRDYGKAVSVKDAEPGDLICFYGHVGIYIGNKRIVHAMDEGHGITVSKFGYNGKPILTVRRLFR
jgi:cell wall-associated NlpC family hydrolase